MNYKIPFRMITPTKYFPPIIPDGVIYGDFDKTDDPIKLDINKTGLIFNNTLCRWTDIEHVSLSENGVATLQSKKLLKQKISFYIHSTYSLNEEGEKINMIQGYLVSLCLINRVFFENQRQTNQCTLS